MSELIDTLYGHHTPENHGVDHDLIESMPGPQLRVLLRDLGRRVIDIAQLQDEITAELVRRGDEVEL